MRFTERDNAGGVRVAFISSGQDSMSIKDKYFYKFDNGSWPESPSAEVAIDWSSYQVISSDETRLTFSAASIGNNLNNSFVKILEKTFGKYTYWNSVIYYNGSYSGNGQFNLLLDNPNSDANVFVKSDAKVFLHTMVTQVPYEVCKNWTVEEWEYNKEHYNDICLDFTGATMNSTMGNYDIPVDQIPEGSCYCVVAHFANNTVRRSKIMQKK